MAQLGRNYEIEDLGGGRFKHTQHLKPIAYEKNGVLKRITNVLGASGDAAFPTGMDELCQFRLDTAIAGKSPLMYFGKGQSRVTLALIGANNVSGVVTGNSVKFPNAWDNADYRLTMANHRLQKDIFFRTGHPRSLAFRIDEHVGFDPKTLEFGNDFRILQPVLHDPKGLADVPLKWVVTQSGGKWILTVVLPAGDWAGWMLDPTLTLQPDATDGIDTWLDGYSTEQNYNNGVNTGLWIGDNLSYVQPARTLIKFNLSALPSDAIISSATFSLYATVDVSANARTFRVFRQKRAWVEGTRTSVEDNPATGATWGRYDTTNNWQTAGGFGANDCEQTDIGSRNFTATETLDEFKNFALTPTTKAGLDLGNGWLIKADTELDDLYVFASSDHATAAYRPKLVVVGTWTVPAPVGPRMMQKLRFGF